MVKVQINYDPNIVKTDLFINGILIEENGSPLTYVINRRLQEWVEPRGSWPGIFRALRNSCCDNHISIEFFGSFIDFEDFVFAKGEFGGNCFSSIGLIFRPNVKI